MGDDPGSERHRRDYRPSWRCEGCGTVCDELPEACPECGGESFRAIEQWSG